VQLLTPVILATLEAEVRRVTVYGQPGQKKSWPDPISTNKKLGVVVYIIISTTQEA
jgi:hypothetical protein